MKTRSKFLIGISLFLLVLSCKRDNDDISEPVQEDKYYIKFKADGVQQDYRAKGRNIGAIEGDPIHDVYRISIECYGHQTLAWPRVQISIVDVNPIELNKVYRNDPNNPVPDRDEPHTDFFYDEDLNTSEDHKAYDLDENTQILITGQTDYDIAGTFSGIVSDRSNPSEKKTITDGSFFVKRVQ